MRPRTRHWSLLALLLLAPPLASAAELTPIALPVPHTEGGMPLMQALKARATGREFAPDPLPLQVLSDLLWATWGINRPATGKRTAPSARNWQETDVYVILAAGAYLYDAAGNALKPVAAADLRPLAGVQEFVKDAPLTLVFVADTARMKGAEPAMHQAYAWGDAAFLSENAYLFCASQGLVTGVRAMVDRPPLARALKLAPAQVVSFAQSVGYPKKK